MLCLWSICVREMRIYFPTLMNHFRHSKPNHILKLPSSHLCRHRCINPICDGGSFFKRAICGTCREFETSIKRELKAILAHRKQHLSRHQNDIAKPFVVNGNIICPKFCSCAYVFIWNHNANSRFRAQTVVQTNNCYVCSSIKIFSVWHLVCAIKHTVSLKLCMFYTHLEFPLRQNLRPAFGVDGRDNIRKHHKWCNHT